MPQMLELFNILCHDTLLSSYCHRNFQCESYISIQNKQNFYTKCITAKEKGHILWSKICKDWDT